ncbi:MAG: dihydroorotase/N-acyl-D-amino-acid deacylase [Roseivirga sp.]|jgi:dihydroorotase/N-acyl-D-amino-acid deacylase
MNPTTMKQFILSACLAVMITACQPAPSYDIIIKGGTVYDGSTEPPQQTDIAINGDQIVKMGDLSKAKATRVIEANGMAVSPGFIDLHAHIESIMKLPAAESAVRQGVTTVLGGPDGRGPSPMKAYLDSLSTFSLGINTAYLTGHNTIRRRVMGTENRAPNNEELEDMKAMVQEAMDHGAFGISTGLKYVPGSFSKVDEVIALSKIAGEAGGIYTSHLREEGLGLLEAVQEAIMISREANIPVVLTHHKAIGRPMWGKSVQTLQMVDSARNLGLDIMIDQYPYTASSTGLSVLIPTWAMAGGNSEFKKRLDNPATRKKIVEEITFNIEYDRGGADLEVVQFASVSWKPDLNGKTLKDWVIERGLEPTFSNGAELVIEGQLNGGASCIFHAINEEDVKRIMQHPMTMIASDGGLLQPGVGHPHPRGYGTFPRVLGHYVREEGVLDLQTALIKMTSLPADRLGLKDRGYLKEGMKADITIFDPNTVKDMGTFEEPHQYPVGIAFVLLNGQVTVAEGEFTAVRAGKVLRRN